jgi:CelD/BcsL family acetyltransferase involved in cellulose biosynthesis
MTDREVDGLIEEVGAPQGRLAREWEQLAARVGATPFLYPGFVLAWQRAFDDRPLLLATVRRAGELVGALPLIRRGAVLVSPANWHTPETGVLARDELAASELARVIAAARPRRISLAFIDGADGDTLALSAEIGRAGYRVLERTLTRSPYLELRGDWAEFETGMKSSARRNLRRLRRRLQELGTLTLDEVDGGVRLDEGLAEFIRVEGLAWKSRRGTAIDSRQDTRGFYDDVARWAAERGWLRIHILRLGSDPVAVSLAIEAHKVFFGVKLGYDPAHSRLSPGMIMLDELVRRAFENRLSRVEMLGTDDAYKRTWCPDTHERIGLQAFAPSLAGRIDHLAYAHGRPLAKRLVANRLLTRSAIADGPRL